MGLSFSLYGHCADTAADRQVKQATRAWTLINALGTADAFVFVDQEDVLVLPPERGDVSGQVNRLHIRGDIAHL